MKSSEEIIQEIEKRIKYLQSFPSHTQDYIDQGKEDALDSLLSWITEKGTDE